ncbi:hypothetical protein BASA61_009457 [Batrachochytrium salamandrivorans]|nr:hypothetical protein BASA61_009457 [Batrachochytrium salamandrivorans]
MGVTRLGVIDPEATSPPDENALPERYGDGVIRPFKQKEPEPGFEPRPIFTGRNPYFTKKAFKSEQEPEPEPDVVIEQVHLEKYPGDPKDSRPRAKQVYPPISGGKSDRRVWGDTYASKHKDPYAEETGGYPHNSQHPDLRLPAGVTVGMKHEHYGGVEPFPGRPGWDVITDEDDEASWGWWDPVDRYYAENIIFDDTETNHEPIYYPTKEEMPKVVRKPGQSELSARQELAGVYYDKADAIEASIPEMQDEQSRLIRLAEEIKAGFIQLSLFRDIADELVRAYARPVGFTPPNNPKTYRDPNPYNEMVSTRDGERDKVQHTDV